MNSKMDVKQRIDAYKLKWEEYKDNGKINPDADIAGMLSNKVYKEEDIEKDVSGLLWWAVWEELQKDRIAKYPNLEAMIDFGGKNENEKKDFYELVYQRISSIIFDGVYSEKGIWAPTYSVNSRKKYLELCLTSYSDCLTAWTINRIKYKIKECDNWLQGKLFVSIEADIEVDDPNHYKTVVFENLVDIESVDLTDFENVSTIIINEYACEGEGKVKLRIKTTENVENFYCHCCLPWEDLKKFPLANFECIELHINQSVKNIDFNLPKAKEISLYYEGDEYEDDGCVFDFHNTLSLVSLDLYGFSNADYKKSDFGNVKELQLVGVSLLNFDKIHLPKRLRSLIVNGRLRGLEGLQQAALLEHLSLKSPNNSRHQILDGSVLKEMKYLESVRTDCIDPEIYYSLPQDVYFEFVQDGQSYVMSYDASIPKLVLPERYTTLNQNKVNNENESEFARKMYDQWEKEGDTVSKDISYNGSDILKVPFLWDNKEATEVASSTSEESINYSNYIIHHSSWNEYDHTEDIQNLNQLLFPFVLKVSNYVDAPTVTTYFSDLDVSTKINAVLKLEKNVAIALNDNNIRMYLEGARLCIEKKGGDNVVSMGDLYTKEFTSNLEHKLWVMIGKDVHNNNVYTDLTDAPHMLVAGTTGSGKSIFLHTLILSLLMNNTSHGLQLIGVDPKGVEFNDYRILNNFTFISETEEAIEELNRLCEDMDKRYKYLQEHNCRDIASLHAEGGDMAYKVCVIDEFADLIMTGGSKVEKTVVRLAQKARACGIHLVLATQRPSADVLTGLIKTNIPCRVALTVRSGVDSRIIIDENGAERLNGHGDLLFMGKGDKSPTRCQGCYVDKTERRNILMLNFFKTHGISLPQEALKPFESITNGY